MPNLWRTGRQVPLNVYVNDRPVCQCHSPEDARRIVAGMNYAEARIAADIEQQIQILREPQKHHCAGEIVYMDSPDRTTKPCPRPARWISPDTGPFCDVHKNAIENLNPGLGPHFRPIEEPSE